MIQLQPNQPVKSKIFLPTMIVVGLLFLVCAFLVVARIGNTTQRSGQNYKAFFVGNSMTAANDLPKAIAGIAQSMGDHLEYDSYAPGGYTFYMHMQDNKILAEKMAAQQWDYVVLQEQSGFPALQDERVAKEVMPYAQQLDEMVHRTLPGASTVLFETWGYKDGDAQYCPAVPTLCDYTIMQDQLQKSYQAMSIRTGSLLAPVGEAWRLARQSHPEIELYSPDGKHPAPTGTYLAACVFYMTLFNKDITGAAALDIDPGTAKILQEIAEETVEASK